MRLIDGRFGYRDCYEAGAGFTWLAALPVLAALGLVFGLVWISAGFHADASWLHFLAAVALIAIAALLTAGIAISIVAWLARILTRVVTVFRG